MVSTPAFNYKYARIDPSPLPTAILGHQIQQFNVEKLDHGTKEKSRIINIFTCESNYPLRGSEINVVLKYW